MSVSQSDAPRPVFAWELLDRIADWSLRLAALVALGGLLFSGDSAFALGCLAGAIATEWVVRIAVRKGAEGGGYDLAPTMVLVVGRLVAVTAVLGAAFLMPTVLAPIGAIVGIVTFDLTLALGGSFIAIRRGFGGAREGG